MQQHPNNFAYIDGANLHQRVKALGWTLDYGRFRVWLKEKYSIQKAYLFLGLIADHQSLYAMLQESGFTLVLKETIRDGSGKVKGNCDADLVLQAVRDVYEKAFDKAVLVSGDGDFASLCLFLMEKEKLEAIVAPSVQRCSILLKRTGARIISLNDFKLWLQNEKAPAVDGTAEGSFT